MTAPTLSWARLAGDSFTTGPGNWLLPGIAGNVVGNDLTDTTSVTFNGAACTFTVVDDNDVTVTVPQSGVGLLTVTTPGGTASITVSVPTEHSDWMRDEDQSAHVNLSSFYRHVDASSDANGWNGVGATVSSAYYGQDELVRNYSNPGNNFVITQRYWYASMPAVFPFHAETDEPANVAVVERDAGDPDVVHWPITVETYLGGTYYDGLNHTTPSDPTQQLRLLPGEHPPVTIGFSPLPDPGWLTPASVSAARLCLQYGTPNTGSSSGGSASGLLSFTVSESEADSSGTLVFWSGSNYFANQVVPPSGAVPGATSVTGGVGLGGTVGRSGGDLLPTVPPVARFTYTPSRYRFWIKPTPLVLTKPDQTPTHLVFNLTALNEGYDPSLPVGLSFAGTAWSQIAPVSHDDAKETGIAIHKPEFARTTAYEGYYLYPSATTPAGDAFGYLDRSQPGEGDGAIDQVFEPYTQAAVIVPNAYQTPVPLSPIFARSTIVPQEWDWVGMGFQDGRFLTIGEAFAPYPNYVAQWRDSAGTLISTVDPTSTLQAMRDATGVIIGPESTHGGLFIAKDVVALGGAFEHHNSSIWYLWDLAANSFTYVGDVVEWVAGMAGVGTPYASGGNLAWSPGENALVFYGEVLTESPAPDGTVPTDPDFVPGFALHAVNVLVVLDATTFEVRSRTLGPSTYSWYKNGFGDRQFWVEPGFTADNTTAFLGINPVGPVVDEVNDRYVYIGRFTDDDFASFAVPASRTWAHASWNQPGRFPPRISCQDVWRVDLRHPASPAVMVASLQHPDPLLRVVDSDTDRQLWYFVNDMQPGWLFDTPDLDGGIGPQSVDFWRPRA